MYATRQRKRSTSKTHDKVMTAVRTLLDEGTFHESTVEEVAQLAGVSRASLYQRFGSRLGLVDAICQTFAANPALVELRTTTDTDAFVEMVVDFWSSEETILTQLYGAAAVDPAAGALVERQRRDRYGELKRLMTHAGHTDRRTFAALALLTSFETYLELRRHAALPRRDVITHLQSETRRLLAPNGPRRQTIATSADDR